MPVEILNTPPVLKKDYYVMDEDTVLTLNVLGNDTDPDGDTLRITAVSGMTHGTAIINEDNTITYTPHADYNGADAFYYTVSDDHGGSAYQIVKLSVQPVADEVEQNTPPTLVKDSATVQNDATVTIPVLANDTDLDGDTLSVVSLARASNGTVVLNADGTVTYTPKANFVGTDTFLYTVSDGNGATVTQGVNVTVVAPPPPNHNPVTKKDWASLAENTSAVINVLGNDSDPDGDTLIVSSVGAAGHGTVVINTDNTLTYTPNQNYYGSDSFFYTASDGRGGLVSQLVTLNVTHVQGETGGEEQNISPVALKDSVTINEDTSTIIRVLANDSDANGDALTIASVGTAKYGTVVINADNTVTYKPNADYFGGDIFQYTVSDGKGGTASQFVSVTVRSVADGDIEGTLKADTLTGTSAGETIAGLAGNDIIHAGEGDDTIIGGYGNDTLFGDLGADMFVFTVGGGVDTVKDFNLEEGDGANFDTLIESYDPLVDNLIDFLSATTEGANTVVSVDRDGTGTDFGWERVAIVENVVLPPIENETPAV